MWDLPGDAEDDVPDLQETNLLDQLVDLQGGGGRGCVGLWLQVVVEDVECLVFEGPRLAVVGDGEVDGEFQGRHDGYDRRGERLEIQVSGQKLAVRGGSKLNLSVEVRDFCACLGI